MLAHRDPDATPATIDDALRLGARFLASRQRRNGVWKGFLLPPGASTTWLTGHVAFVVEDVPVLTEACRRAANYLEATGLTAGGWGYNRDVAVDADSTAQALLVLRRFGRPIPEFLVDALLAAQLPHGGFTTYAASGGPVSGWNAGHEDVTALAAEALRRLALHDRERAARTWLSERDAATTFASYWWPGAGYGVWARARAGLSSSELRRTAARILAHDQATPQGAFALAAASIMGAADPVTRSKAALYLLRSQHADGSWPCAPCLRVTDPSEIEAGYNLRGCCYADETRVFSTAHAIAALNATLRDIRWHQTLRSPPE